VIKYIVFALVLGGIVGYLNNDFGSSLATVLVRDYLFNGALAALLFVMGLVFGLDRDAIGKMRRMGLKILVVPFAVASGSIAGAVVIALILKINVVATASLSAGFGWYTLAGPLAGQLLGVKWGAFAFTTNFFREMLTILTVPLAVRLDKYVPVAFGGATSMDTTLPVIVKYGGSEMLIMAFSSGFILSLIAPITIIGIASLV